jgi:hypothetical protein
MSKRAVLIYDGDDGGGRGGGASHRDGRARALEKSVRTSASTTMRRVGLLAVVILCGCSGAGSEPAPMDDHHFRTLVSYVSEYHANPRQFEPLFADGRVPDKVTRAKLRGMMTKLERALVDDTGSSATAEVVYEVLETGEILGPVEWKLTKIEGQWKVSDFALPGGSAASP